MGKIEFHFCLVQFLLIFRVRGGLSGWLTRVKSDQEGRVTLGHRQWYLREESHQGHRHGLARTASPRLLTSLMPVFFHLVSTLKKGPGLYTVKRHWAGP